MLPVGINLYRVGKARLFRCLQAANDGNTFSGVSCEADQGLRGMTGGEIIKEPAGIVVTTIVNNNARQLKRRKTSKYARHHRPVVVTRDHHARGVG